MNTTGDQRLPEASLLNFLSGLGSQGLMQLGAMTNPQTGELSVNLPFARYTVQLLRVFEEKTAGNRSADEDQYLSGIIADLEARLAQAEAAAG